MFNNRCVRTRPKLHLNELFSCPHLPLDSCFSQPLLPLPLCLIFFVNYAIGSTQAPSCRNRPNISSLIQLRRELSLFFPFFPPAALICVPTHVQLKPPTDFRNFSFPVLSCLPLFLSFVVCVFHLFPSTSTAGVHSPSLALARVCPLFDTSLLFTRRDGSQETKACVVNEGLRIVFREII